MSIGALPSGRYPPELETQLTLRAGETIYLRPIRPEDESLLREFATHLSAADMRFRFFVPLHEIDHPFAEHLANVDYVHEIAFLAFAGAGREGELWGISRLYADASNSAAEFAITVRSDRQDRGLGTALMHHLIGTARRWGIGELFGDVLGDNTRMLTLCDELGMTRTRLADDPSIIRVALKLPAAPAVRMGV